MVQYNTFFVSLTDTGEAQARLNAFLRSHRVLQVQRNSFADGWGFCVEWMEGTPSGSVGDTWRKVSRIDYKEVLDPEAFTRFSALRERRKAIAAEDGVPPYMVMTDAQLAEIAKLNDPTAGDLKGIDGVGEARINKYGEKLLAK